MHLLKTLPLALAAMVMAGAVIIQAFDPMGELPEPRPKHLAQLIPVEIPGWQAEVLPLGPNEFVDARVSQTLNFDDVFNVRYRRGRQEFGVYVAYWGAGKMPTRLVASHTPDRCWSENGWTCLDMRFYERLEPGGVALQPADWRWFRPPHGEPIYVVFWHLIEGRVYDYGGRFNQIPHPFEWWKDVVRQMVQGSREQYFIRVTSSGPFEQIMEDEGFQLVMQGLARVGLAEKPLP
jgi:hypothetical protein